MGLVIYGTPRSRTLRVLWLAAEVGVAFEHRPLDVDDPHLKSPEFLALNPAGSIPVIVDDGFALSESLAINLYLARKYGAHGAAPLWPARLEAQAEAWRWSLFAQGHLEPWIQRDARLAGLRAAVAAASGPVVREALETLERALGRRPWLLGERFTVADLNVAAVLSPSRAEHLDLAGAPRTRAWLAACYDRPAARATRERYA